MTPTAAQAATAAAEPDAPRAAASAKFLAFSVDDAAYGMPVLRVREIIGMLDITPVPQVARHVRGVVNLRGKVIPVVDLHVTFGRSSGDHERSCIVVVDVRTSRGPSLVGLIVDAVSEVIALGPADVEPPPEVGRSDEEGYLLGIARTRNGVRMLLDIDRLLAVDALSAAAPVHPAADTASDGPGAS